MTTALLIAACLLVADEPAPDAAPDATVDKLRQEEVARLAPAEARRLAVISGSEQPVTTKLHDQPLLRWSNPTAGSVYGEVFVWTVADRPVAIASIYRWYHPFKDSTVEFVSVSEAGLQAKDDEKTQWNTMAPGIAWAAVPGAAPPAEAARARLGQMRTLAREFSAELADERGGETVVRKLRLLDQPVYRYQSESSKVVDGGLFAFVEGTDPEAWLLLEAVETAGGPRWNYAAARMNIDQLRMRHGDTVVKEWTNLRDAWSDRTTPYVMFNFDPRKVQPPAGPNPAPVKVKEAH